MNNSLKFTKNGTITITAEIDKKYCNHKVIHQIIVRVKDTGTGIDLDILPRLFSKFVTKSNDGGGGDWSWTIHMQGNDRISWWQNMG